MSDNVYVDVCYNDANIKRVKFVFMIRKFSSRIEKVTSPLFPSSAPNNAGKWCLVLDPVCREDNKCLHISIVLKEETGLVSLAEATFSLIRVGRRVAKTVVSQYRKGCINRCALVERYYVTDKPSDYLPNDELTICCEIKIVLPAVNRSTGTYEPPPCRLVEDWGNLLASKSLSDVTIAVRGAELRAHKIVLAARSPVFAAMFSNDMLEKETSVVEITDFDADVVQAMLEFMYTGKVILQTSWTHDLLAASTKYQLERLKFMSEEALCKALSLDNVLENLALADLYSAARLKEHCMNIVTDHSVEILTSPSWDIFKRSHQSLVPEIMETICRHK